VALEQEIQAREGDVSDAQHGAQHIAQQLTALATAIAQAPGLVNQFTATLATAVEQLAPLPTGVHDVPSANQATAAAQPILTQCQQALLQLSPAEQAWNTVTGLAQQRSTWLQSRWQQTHQEPPPGAAIAMADPLAQALNGYSSAAAQLDARIRAAAQFPPPPNPAGPAGPPAVAAWLQACQQQLSGARSQISAAAAQLSALSWGDVESAASGAVATAQGLLGAALRVAAALTGPVDPAGLPDRLADLTALRVSACPDPIAPGDSAIYRQRMTELDQALTGLLAAPAGAAADIPLALLPVRLETRTFPTSGGGTEFRIRIYVDSIHINAHDPRLTDDEAQWADHLKAAATGTLTEAQWAQAASRFGPARAAYLLNPDTNAGTRPGPWARAATATALPDRWLAIGYGPDGRAIGAALGAPIVPPLQVGPDPSAATSAASDADLQVDPGVRWMIDFGEALNKGMGVSLLVDGGAAGTATGHATLSQLLVVGVRAGDGTQALTDLLNAHHHTSGLELVGYGTPTNSTAEAPAGFSRSDPGYARSYALEVLRPCTGGDAARLAAALGIDPGIFAAAATGPLVQQQDQQAMTALTWPATWGTFLTGFAGMGPGRAEQLRSWAVAWLRPEGPSATLRVGPRPYGILPVVDLAQWADPADSAATDVHTVVTGLTGTWLAADPAAAGLDFDTLLTRRPVTAEAWGRFTGIMSGWLQPGSSLGLGYEQIQATITALPGLLSQIGSACGLPGSLTWPAGFLVLPDPAGPTAPWPLVPPNGSLPLATGPVPPGAYLTALLGGSPAAQPAALLDFAARQSWAATAGMQTAGGTFAPRGNLGDSPEPAAPRAADELHAAAGYLAGRADADFDSLFGGALDACAHRLDSWATALATRRLGQLRAARKTGIGIGGFSWVEGLVARDPLPPVGVEGEPGAVKDLYSAGHQLAPSIQQATTAAVMRSAYLTRHPLSPGAPPPAPGAPFAIDLSSRRARLAAWLLDGVRQGQPLSLLLGYRFERALQEASPSLGDLIAVFRQAAPYSPVITTSSETGSATPTEAALPSGVADGMALYELTQSPQQPPPPPSTLAAGQASQWEQAWAQAGPALAELTDAIDAIADAVTAQAVHEALTGNTYAAAAALDSVASGAVPPPQLSFLSTPRTGIAVNHRVLVPVSAGQPYPPPGWPATPRGSAEPALTAWLASLLGDPAAVTAAVTLTDQTGAPLPGSPVTIALSSLGLGPLDVVALAAQTAELERLAVHIVIAAGQPAGPAASGGTLDPSPPGAARPLAAVLTIARNAGQLIGTGRGADARDLAPAGTVSAPGANLADLATRVNGTASGPPGVVGELASAAAALSAALGDPPPGSAQATGTGAPAGADPGALATALVKAVMLGIPAAAPAGTGTASLETLANQARGASAEITARQAAIQQLETTIPQPGPASPDPAIQSAVLAARLAQLETAFGGGFQALPLVTTSPPDLLAQAAALTQTATTDPGQGPDAWLVKASRVREPVADLLATCCAAEALGTGPAMALTAAQLPLPGPPASGAAPEPVPWAGLPFTGDPPVANTLSLMMMAAEAPPAGQLSALLVDGWAEVIPSQRETVGLTYHYDAPGAQAPQCVLLAVPARPDTATWSYADLASTVNAARDLAHIRGVDYADLPAPARLVFPAAYFSNPPVARPGPWKPPTGLSPLDVPANYPAQAPPAQINSVSVQGAAQPVLQQGAAGQLDVAGANFAPSGPDASPPLTYSSFTVTAATGGGKSGVVITGGTVSDTLATLSVSVDPQAPPGPRGLAAGAVTVTNCLTITPQPRVTGCDTARLAQETTMTTQVITVTGQALAQPVVALSKQALVTVQGTSVSADGSQLKVTVRIAASTYRPYQTSDQVAGRTGTVPVTYRPPVHELVSLTLSVTLPPGGSGATFPIVLDVLT
jgi:hypothetical protein